jgi:hypothetical protein
MQRYEVIYFKNIYYQDYLVFKESNYGIRPGVETIESKYVPHYPQNSVGNEKSNLVCIK